MDIDKDLLISDSRFLRNNIVRNKIENQLTPIQIKMKLTFYYDLLIFIINKVNINQVIVSIPAMEEHYCGDIVLLLTVIGEITCDDILNSLSSYTGPELQIEEFDSSYPFYFNQRKTNETYIFPGRYENSAQLYRFIRDNTSDNLKGGRFYFEANSSIDKLDLNEIYLIFKNSENKIIFKYIFQDSFTGILVSLLETNDNNNDQGFLSWLFNRRRHKGYNKFKND